MIKKILLKIALLSSPLLLLILIFIYKDPFKIIFDYKDYSPTEKYFINRDFISSRVFVKNYSKYKYNSFIFGSSRTMAFNPNHWKNHLDSNSNVYSFDSFGESIFGIYSKIKFLDTKNVCLNNCLLVFCEDVTFEFSSDHPGHIYMKDPLVAKTSYVNFYFEHFKAFIQLEFFSNYIKEKIFNHKSTNQNYTRYDLKNNNMSNRKLEFKIKNRYIKYVDTNFILSNNNLYEPKSINKINYNQISMLNEIKFIFNKQHTKYKIIISPLYNQRKIDKMNLKILKSIFGNSIYNFSGKNNITENKFNYYEFYDDSPTNLSRNKSSHYISKIGDILMDSVYSK